MRRLPQLVGTLAAAVLVADLVVVATHDSPAAGWDARVLPLVRFVEQERGLSFERAVPVRFLDDAAFEAKVAPAEEESKEEKEELQRYVAQFRALGLLRGPLDLAKAYDDLAGASVIGLYLSEEQAVYVRGTELTPAVRGTLVHELTHVLQDQHFDLDRLQDEAPDGDATAVTALIEGDAVRVEEAYRDGLSRRDLESYQQDQLEGYRESQERSSAVPAVLQDFLGFPYVFGPVLLDSLSAAGGNQAVDKAFRRPPTAEAQVLDPVGHPYDEDPVEVKEPALPAGAKALDDAGPFGQVFLFDVLGSQLGYQLAWDAVQGWEGDRFVGYRLGGKVCAAGDIAMADADAAARLAATARRWAARVPGATVGTRDRLVSLRSCDPGTAGAPLPKQDPSAFDVLVVRTQVVHELTRSGAAYPVARCIADAVLQDARADGYKDLTSDDPDDEAIEHFHAVVTGAAAGCRSVRG